MSGFLASLFVAPASQFQNEFLRTEEHFSALRITLFTLGTNTPGALGIIVGGHLADVRGRRLVGAVGLFFGAGLTVMVFVTHGPQIWAWSVAAAILAAATIPALGVYGPELFPTGLRGRANGVISVVSVAGSSIGLLVAGWMADWFGSFGAGAWPSCSSGRDRGRAGPGGLPRDRPPRARGHQPRGCRGVRTRINRRRHRHRVGVHREPCLARGRQPRHHRRRHVAVGRPSARGHRRRSTRG